MTKLDQKWAQGIRDSVNALILEVERLESVGGEAESSLAAAQAEVAKYKAQVVTTVEGYSETLAAERAKVAELRDELLLFPNGQCPSCGYPKDDPVEGYIGMKSRAEAAEAKVLELQQFNETLKSRIRNLEGRS